ncbi:MAG: hypothetical protein AB7P33_03735 [Dehalococcoidia bacterium]
MITEGPFDRFQRKRREWVAEMRRIRDETDVIIDKLETAAPATTDIQDLARLEGLRAQRAQAFEAYQTAEDELINALLANLKAARGGS